MGYHIHALLVGPGQEARDALAEAIRREEAAEGDPLDPGKQARKRSIASALSTAPGLGYEVVEHDYSEVAEEQDRPEDEIRREVRHVHVDNGTVHVDIDDEHVSLSIPYAEALEPDEVAETVFDTLRILRDEMLVPYDPQLERELDLDSDREAFLEAFRRGIENARERGDREQLAQRPRPPWWRRLLRLGR